MSTTNLWHNAPPREAIGFDLRLKHRIQSHFLLLSSNLILKINLVFNLSILYPTRYMNLVLFYYVYELVGAKNKGYALILTWAHNLFAMWVLDFLLWAILGLETQQYNATLRIPLLPLLLLFLCSLFYLSFFILLNAPSSSSSLIYSLRLVDGRWLLLIVSA